MTMRPDSVASRAIELIRSLGVARSSALSERLKIEDVTSALAPHVKSGALVMCKVERPGGGRAENEYRISASGPRSSRLLDMEVKRQHAVRSPIVPAGPIRRGPEYRLPSRIAIDAAEAVAHSNAAPPAHIPTAHIPAEEGMPATLKEAPRMSELVTVAKPFRCALASDGSLLLFVPGHDRTVDLTPEWANELVEYFRKLAKIEPAPDDLIRARGPSTPTAVAPAAE